MPLDAVGSTARQELAAINREIEAATVVRDEAQRQVDRLSVPVASLDRALSNAAELRAIYDARISRWYADGCPDRRPDEPPDLMALENTVRQLTGDGNASRPALQAATVAVDEHNARLGTLAANKSCALFRSAAEAAREYLENEAKPAMVEAMRRLSAVESLVSELSRLGVRESEAASAAHGIERQIFMVRSSLAVRGDLSLAAEFLVRLARDPAAELTAPHHVKLEHLDPPCIKPAEDGTKYLNRGPPEPPVEPTFPTSFGDPEGWAFMPPQRIGAHE
jgi:hypothetical protein